LIDEVVSMKIAHILPFTLGIVDYANRLSEQLSRVYGIESILIPVTETVITPDPTYLDKFPIHKLKCGKDNPLLDAIPEDISGVIVHFDFELMSYVEALQDLRRKRDDLKIVFMVHEFFPRWPMSFRSRLSIEFKRLINSREGNVYLSRAAIVKLADHIFTNSQVFQSVLSRLTNAPVICLPTFSNVGEPKEILSCKKRIRRMVIFGSAGSRERVYTNSAKALLKSCGLLGIEEIVDIGPFLEKDVQIFSKEIPVTAIGPQSSIKVSEVLSESMAGFIDYSHNPRIISKSGVFAAYSAHGLVTVLSQPLKHETDNLKLNEHYTTWKNLKNVDTLKMQNISTNAFDWYQEHNVVKCAEKFSLVLSQ